MRRGQPSYAEIVENLEYIIQWYMSKGLDRKQAVNRLLEEVGYS